MGNAHHFLFDDRPFVEVAGDVVAGGTDDFHAALVGGVVGFCADECGEKGVVDVDDAVGLVAAVVVGTDLHVARQHDDIDVVLFNQFELFLFLFGLGFF